MRELFYGQRRFTEIARNTGAPRDILATRLRKLEEHGVVSRTQYSDRPPRFEYNLTASGRGLSPVLLTLKQWGSRHVHDGPDPVTFGHDCGHELKAELRCAACDHKIRTDSLSIRSVPE